MARSINLATRTAPARPAEWLRPEHLIWISAVVIVGVASSAVVAVIAPAIREPTNALTARSRGDADDAP